MKSQWAIQKIPVDMGHTIATKLKDRIRDTTKISKKKKENITFKYFTKKN